jgi:hypothetical protein
MSLQVMQFLTKDTSIVRVVEYASSSRRIRTAAVVAKSADKTDYIMGSVTKLGEMLIQYENLLNKPISQIILTIVAFLLGIRFKDTVNGLSLGGRDRTCFFSELCICTLVQKTLWLSQGLLGTFDSTYY